MLAAMTTLVISAAPSISGVVVDQFDRPVLTSVCASSGGCVDTDAKGRFAFKHLKAGTYLVGPVMTEPDPIEVRTGTAPVVLRVHAKTRLRGQVVDESGQPVDDLRIDDLHVGAAFDIALEPLPTQVELSAPGFATEVVTLPAADERGDVDLRRVILGRGREVTVTVTDSNGSAVTSARLALTATNARLSAAVARKWKCGEDLMAWIDAQVPPKMSATGTYTFRLSPSQTELVVLSDGHHANFAKLPAGVNAATVTLSEAPKPR
jgi:hypothetical protein